MRKLWRDLWAVHDMSGLGHIGQTVPGVEHYADRALLLPVDVAVVPEDHLDDYLDYLRNEAQIGPKRVIQVKGNDLLAGIRDDPRVMDEFRTYLMRGGRVQLFYTTAKAVEFFDSQGISWNHVHSAPLEISLRMNNKAELRRIAAAISMGHIFPKNVCLRDPRRIGEEVGRLLDSPEADFAVLKRTDLAGGDGMIFVRRGDDDPAAAVGDYLRRHSGREIVVEAGYDGDLFSTQLILDQRMLMLGPTRQVVDSQGRHAGNAFARNPREVCEREDAVTMEAWSKALSAYAIQHNEGYRGTIGFDFLRRKRDGRLYMLECNGRQTASTYPLAVSAQIETRAKDWGIVMLNAVPTKARTFGELKQKLGDLLFLQSRGALPFNIRLMTLPEPCCGIVAVAESLAAAEAMMEEAKKRLVS